MSKKSIDSSPISHLQDIFNVKQENIKSQSLDISLMTEINDQKVIMDFHWIKDLSVLITSFSIDNFEFSFLTNHINKINNNLVIGTLKQNTDNTIVYRHSLPITGHSTSDDMRLYLENILSEFNHLISVLLKNNKIAQESNILINQKIVGHA